jgi:hypothetical protein
MAATLLAGFFVVFVYDSVTEDEVLTMEDISTRESLNSCTR